MAEFESGHHQPTRDRSDMRVSAKKIIGILLLPVLFCLIPEAVRAVPSSFDVTAARIRVLKQEFDRKNKAIDERYRESFNAIEKDYYLLINKAELDMPKPPAPKDLFETQAEYARRLDDYKLALDKAEKKKIRAIKKIKQEYNLNFYMSREEVRLLKEKIQVLQPLIDELQTIQNTRHPVHDENVQVLLFEPEPEKNRFPIHLVVGETRYTEYWPYTDRETARTFWKNKSALRGEKLVQCVSPDGTAITWPLTAIRVTNKNTGDRRDFLIEAPAPFDEITLFNDMKNEALPAAELMVALKDVIKGPVADMQFIFISPRSFMMGSPRDEIGRWANETRHKVRLTQGFYIQTTEVTQGQWRDIMGENPSVFSRCGSDCPVENVFWGDALEFIDRLNKREGTDKYRMPTEAEWEFACRAGTTTMGAYGDDPAKLPEYGWFKDNADGSPHPVAQLKPNAWGLYDMHGNVSEWCSDWFGPYPDHETTDPKGPYSGKFRVARGGNWFMPARNARSADRNENLPGDRSEYIGFRVVKSP
jgi:formylglycine-generating enzyme required for sulfatase activity